MGGVVEGDFQGSFLKKIKKIKNKNRITVDARYCYDGIEVQFIGSWVQASSLEGRACD